MSDDITLTFKESVLASLVNFLANNKDFADIYPELSSKNEAVATLGASMPVSVTIPTERANDLFELVSSILADLAAVPEQSGVWQVLSTALEKT